MALLDTIDSTSKEIELRVNTALGEARINFGTRLDDIQQRCLSLEKSLEAKEDMMTQPAGEVLLEWESVDTAHSGKTTLNSRIRKLGKIMEAEEASIGQAMEQLRQVNLELEQTRTEIEGSERQEEVNLDVPICGQEDQASTGASSMQAQLKIEHSKWRDAIDSSNKVTVKRMTDSEKVRPGPISIVARYL